MKWVELFKFKIGDYVSACCACGACTTIRGYISEINPRSGSPYRITGSAANFIEAENKIIIDPNDIIKQMIKELK